MTKDEFMAFSLPYGLKVYYKNADRIDIQTLLPIHFDCNCRLVNDAGKPILYSLDYLTKPIDHKGKKFVPIVELLKLKDPVYFERTSGTRYAEIAISSTETKSEAWVKYMAMKEIKVWHDNPSEKPHWLVEKLREWHFDTDGLIEKGEAIAKE